MLLLCKRPSPFQLYTLSLHDALPISRQVADIIGELDPDDRASLFDELPASVAERLMHGLDAGERAMTTTVLGYPRDSIGRYMSPVVLTLRPTWTVGKALAHVRSEERRVGDVGQWWGWT